MLYKNKAYGSGNSLLPASEQAKGRELAKKLAEENKAIGVNLGEDSIIKNDNR